MANIDGEGPSTSIGPSEILQGMLDHGAMGDSPPVEIIRYQPTQVECHCPTSTSGAASAAASTTAAVPTPAALDDGASTAHSSSGDGESGGELQSLVPKQQEVTVEISEAISAEEGCAHKPHCSKCRHDCAEVNQSKGSGSDDKKESVLHMGRDALEEGDSNELEALMAKDRVGQPDTQESTA